MPSHKSLVFAALLTGCCPSAEHPAVVHVDTLPGGALHVKSDGPQWKEGAGWTVAQDLEIVSPEEGDGFFEGVSALAMDAGGGIYLLDGQSNAIQQYNSTGKWVRSIGRKGGGPGEYTGAIGLALRGTNLYVIDRTNVRISVLDTSGALITSHRRNFVNMGDWPWEGGFDTAGTIYDLYGSFRDGGAFWQLARLDRDSFALVDTFPWPTFKGSATLEKNSNGMFSRKMVTLPNTADMSRRFDPRGYVWFGIGTRYEIVQRRLAGDTVRIIERAWTPEPLPADQRKYIDSMVTAMRFEGYTVPQVPTAVPAFDALVLDGAGNLWVGPYASHDTVWHVFDPDGTWLGPVTFPAPITQLAFKGDHYYGVTLDSLDVDHVVRGTVKQ